MRGVPVGSYPLLIALVACNGARDAPPTKPSNASHAVESVPSAVVDAGHVELTTLDDATAPRARPSLEVVDACTPPSVRSDVFRAFDVRYSSPHGQHQHLDIAWPTGKGLHPLVVVIHGGAWIGGDRLYHRDDILRLAGAGYVAATIDYRLAGNPKNAFPAALEDVRCAVRFLRSNAASYGIDPERVAALGDSAGGHLAAMLALAGDVPGDGTCTAIDQRAWVTSAVDYYGPADLRLARRYPASIQQAVRYLLLANPEEDMEKAALASPTAQVDPADSPMLILHGVGDRLVPVEDSRELKRALDAASVPSLYLELPLQHGFLTLGSGAILRRSTCTTMAFLAATLHP